MKQLLLLSTLLLTACAQSQTQSDANAVITDPSAASRNELRAAVAGLLGVADVRLADDALTQSSTLLVERAAAVDAEGRPLNGRDLGRPEKFQLLKQGTQCVVVHVSSGKRAELPHTKCAPVSPD